MLIYVAGKYTGNVSENIAEAEKVSGELWKKGHAVICPHSNTAHFEDKFPEITYDAYLKGDFNIISRVDAVVMLENWKDSNGAKMEHEYAKSLNIPIYYAPDLPEIHKTEVISPEQCQTFREIVGQMYRIHLSKNADYSPANILATGEVGLVTRLWDKTARLMNLTGIKFQALLHEGVQTPSAPKHEAIDDTYQDLAVYSVIGMILRKGKWGK